MFQRKIDGLDGRYKGKDIIAFFSYEEARKVMGSEEQLKALQRQWTEEGRESELRFCLSDGNQSELYTLNNRQIKLVNYVIGEEDYIKSLEERWAGGGVTVSVTID